MQGSLKDWKCLICKCGAMRGCQKTSRTRQFAFLWFLSSFPVNPRFKQYCPPKQATVACVSNCLVHLVSKFMATPSNGTPSIGPSNGFRIHRTFSSPFLCLRSFFFLKIAFYTAVGLCILSYNRCYSDFILPSLVLLGISPLCCDILFGQYRDYTIKLWFINNWLINIIALIIFD